MPRRRLTAQDVAKHAGVSRTTVSFVLNNVEAANISEQTRQRVLAAARELGYVPDAGAQALASGRSQTIGLIIARDTGSSVSTIASGLLEVARASNVRLLIDSVSEHDSAQVYRDLTRAKRIDGVIVFHVRCDETAIHELAQDDVPLVVLGRLPNLRACSIEFDNQAGAAAATRHLLAQGHRRIGIVSYAPLAFTGASERLAGYQQALAEAGIAFDPALLREGGPGGAPESGMRAAHSLLDMAEPPTALFMTSDHLAFGALSALAARGLRVPHDVAVVGFDDHPLAAYAHPPLSTVRVSFEDMGRRAGRLLLDRIQHGAGFLHEELLPTELVVRASSQQVA